MVSVCLSSDALLQHLPSYLGFSYLGRGVSLHGCSRKAQPLLLTLDKGYLLTATLPDLQRGIARLSPPAPTQHRSLDMGLLLQATTPGLGHGVAPPGRHPWPQAWGCSSQPPALAWGVGGSSQLLPLASGSGWLLRVTTPGLGRKVASPGCPWPLTGGGSSRPHLVHRL